MNGIPEALGVIAKHGYLVLFAWVTAEQLGAPVPAVPILIAAGVLSATGQLTMTGALILGVLGCVIGDAVWYAIGKQRGTAVLRFLCRISLEPEHCVRQSSNFISRYGSRSLLITKFIPGISAVAVPLAANSKISAAAFWFFDVVGSVLYVGAYLAIGLFLGDRIDKLSNYASSIRMAAAGIAILAALAIVGWRVLQKRRFEHDVRMARITPSDLLNLIEAGSHPYIVDLRHPLDMLTDPRVIPGAVRMTPAELASRQNEIPRDREIILYCT